MMNMHVNILAIALIYCVIFAWMSVPFITTDEGLLRKQVMFVDSLQDHIVADDAVVATVTN
jgi:hypothetical protein